VASSSVAAVLAFQVGGASAHLIDTHASSQLIVNGGFEASGSTQWALNGSAAVVDGGHCGRKSLSLGGPARSG
jgi:hypothetical protein